MKKIVIFFSLYLFIIQVINSQTGADKVPKRVYITKFLDKETPPIIDGLLNDPSWNIVEWTGDYIENDPDDNTPPTEQTRFKIIYDKKNLYIGIRAFDSQPDSIVKRLSRRDGFAGDWVEFNIDSYHDLRTAFSFTITAAGVKGDEFISNNGNNWDSNWNPIWYAKTNIDEEGWTAEIKIPLSQLRFGKSKEQVWGLQSTRRFFRQEERSLWQRKPRDAPGWVSEFGELHGLIDLEPQKQLEIQPFTLAKLDAYPKEEGNPFRDGNDFELNGGLDAKIGITNDLTLDLTVNPDFGQVEADPSSITLDGFEIFFSERRPFFVENNNIFDYQISNSMAGNTYGSDNLFFSRRIGRSPQGYVTTGDTDYVDTPNNTTILGAAKFSGKTKNGWSIGLLESVTSEELAKIVDEDGRKRKAIIEPMTNYLVTRVQKDFNDRNSFIGGILTVTTRNLGNTLQFDYDDVNNEYINTDDGRVIDPFTYGGKENNLNFLHSAAITGGIDFKHQWKDRSWYIGGNIVMSQVQGSKEAILNTQESLGHLFNRVDAGHLEVDPDRRSLTGTGGNIQIGKQAKGHWRFESGFTWRSPELELNDVGFQRLADDLRHYTWIGYRTLKPKGNFRSIGVNYNHWTAWDFEGNHNFLQFNVNSWAEFKNNWFGNFGLNYRAVEHSNSALRGGPRLRISPMMYYWNNIGTDNRKKIRVSLYNNGGKAFDNSTDFFSAGLSVSYQPTDALRVSLSPSYDINNDKLQFVENVELDDEIKHINASIEQRTLSMSLRINYTINPDLTIQYWGQPFVSRGRYSNFKNIVNAQATDFNNRYIQYTDDQLNLDSENSVYEVDEDLNGVPDFSFSQPDFSFVQFRSNLVVRWEYIPGSEIFLVWSQGVTGSGDPNNNLFDNLDNQILGQKKDNTFLIKATYRFRL